MITAIRQRSKYMPCLNSYFISGFGEDVVSEIKAIRKEHLGGDKYIGNGVWEVSQEVWNRLCHFKNTIIDKGEKRKESMVLEIREDDPLGKYHYQDLAAEELRNRTEALLFFDTGTGKTRTALLALSKLSQNLGGVIIVGESNLSKGWLAQVQTYFPEMANRFIILNDGSGIPKRIQKIRSADNGKIFIVNIESMRNKSFVEALNGRNLAVSILDECQCIIGSGAQQTAGMQALNTVYRWALSATPIKNSPLEWYSLLAWLRVIPFDGMKTRFNEYYAFAERNRFGQWEYTSFRNEQDLEDLKNLVSIRVEKKGLGLPNRHVENVYLQKDTELEETLKKIDKERRKEWISVEFDIKGEEIKADSTSKLFYVERLSTAIAKEKLDFVLSKKEDPMVVVSNLRAPIEYIHSLIPEESVLYHGKISVLDRERNLKDFIDGKKRVLLMTRRSGGTGLDGLQKRARMMIFLDAPENKANFEQCADRLHRAGQEKEVIIYLLKVEGTLDIYSWEHQDEKYGWIDRYYKVRYGVE